MSLPEHPMVDPKTCKELKEKHDVCFYKWYSDKFLKGVVTLDCKEEWDEYQYCLKVSSLFKINKMLICATAKAESVELRIFTTKSRITRTQSIVLLLRLQHYTKPHTYQKSKDK